MAQGLGRGCHGHGAAMMFIHINFYWGGEEGREGAAFRAQAPNLIDGEKFNRRLTGVDFQVVRAATQGCGGSNWMAQGCPGMPMGCLPRFRRIS